MHHSRWLRALAAAALLAIPAVAAYAGSRDVAVMSERSVMVAGDVAPGPVMEALMSDIDDVERKLADLAEAIPAERFDWRPAEGVRSVAEVLMHVAADNYFIPTAAGTAAPETTGIEGDSYATVQAYEGRTVTKEEALAELRASFQHLDAVMGAVDETRLNESIDLFGTESTGLRLWVLTTTHLHEHLGQLIAYARSNGVAPPWSR